MGSDVRVCKAGSAALIRIVQRGSKCAVAVADAGGTSVLVAAMRAHPQNVDVQNVGAATLSRIMESGAVCAQEVVDEGGIAPTVAALQAHQSNVILLTAAYCVLGNRLTLTLTLTPTPTPFIFSLSFLHPQRDPFQQKR